MLVYMSKPRIARPRTYSHTHASLLLRFAVDLEITCPSQYVCVASGELRAQVFTDDSTRTHKTWIYTCPTPILARGLGFAVGQFQIVSETSDHAEAPVTVMHFGLASGASNNGNHQSYSCSAEEAAAAKAHLVKEDVRTIQVQMTWSRICSFGRSTHSIFLLLM